MALPPLLIGPILRRVEPRAVSVFVATRKAGSIRITLYDGRTIDAAAPGAALATGEARTTAFAAAFHATVVTVRLTGSTVLQPGQGYSYDVRVALDGEQAATLLDLGLLADRELPGYGTVAPASAPVEVVALGYGEGRLPSFVTCPPSLDELVLAHASCRKPHGDGTPALQHLDRLIEGIEESAADGRPQMLFLTGDQIYADDVATALLPGLNSLAIELLGDVETVPSPAVGDPLLVNTTVLPAGFRQRTTGLAGFTSDYAWAHLIGFGEFLAMYCLAWNPDLWPVLAAIDLRELDADDPTPEAGSLHKALQDDVAAAPGTAPSVLGRPTPDARENVISPLYDGSNPAARKALGKARREYLASKRLLDAYRREVPRVRRLLANNSTYMICDDHDVTDDWFMTGRIRAETLGNSFGQALVRNALAAYAICQGWGNDPDRWAASGERADLLDAAGRMFGPGWNGGAPDDGAASEVVGVLGLRPAELPRIDFSFTVDGPLHRVRVLDTRTRRQYDTPSAPPGLLSAPALEEQLPLEDLPAGHVLVVVSPAPVYGPPVLSEIGGLILQSKHDTIDIAWSESKRAQERAVTGLEVGTPYGQQYYDAEHWGVHPPAFERLLERLARHPRVVVLAGDVHYGAAYAMDWTGAGRTSRIVHFTASAAKNDWKDTPGNMGAPGFVHNLFALNGFATGLQNVGLPMTRLGWLETLPLVVDDFGEEPPQTRNRVQSGPVVLSNELFRAAHELTRPPDWAWRARPIVDERPSAERPEAARVPAEVTTDIPANGAGVRRYGELAGMHVRALRTQAVARGLQFLNNIGVVTFATRPDGIQVSQALYSLRPRPEPNEDGDAYIVHVASLEINPVAFPARVGPED